MLSTLLLKARTALCLQEGSDTASIDCPIDQESSMKKEKSTKKEEPGFCLETRDFPERLENNSTKSNITVGDPELDEENGNFSDKEDTEITSVKPDVTTPINKSLECPKCNKIQSDKESVSKNTENKCNCQTFSEKVNSKIRIFECSECSESFTRKSALISHIQKHFKVNPFICPVCNKSFNKNSYLARHLRTHKGVNPYKCNKCEKSYAKKTFLVAHLRTHVNKSIYTQLVCDVCNKTFLKQSMFDRHCRSHTGERPFGCPKCSKSFTQKSYLDEHLRNHDEINPFSCDKCPRIFSGKTSLNRHLLLHSVRAFSCQVCGKLFAQEEKLERHLLANHKVRNKLQMC